MGGEGQGQDEGTPNKGAGKSNKALKQQAAPTAREVRVMRRGVEQEAGLHGGHE